MSRYQNYEVEIQKALEYWYFEATNQQKIMNDIDYKFLKKSVNYLTSPYDMPKVKLKEWLGDFENGTYISDISLPGSYNSISGDVSKIYNEHNSL